MATARREITGPRSASCGPWRPILCSLVNEINDSPSTLCCLYSEGVRADCKVGGSVGGKFDVQVRFELARSEREASLVLLRLVKRFELEREGETQAVDCLSEPFSNFW